MSNLNNYLRYTTFFNDKYANGYLENNKLTEEHMKAYMFINTVIFALYKDYNASGDIPNKPLIVENIFRQDSEKCKPFLDEIKNGMDFEKFTKLVEFSSSTVFLSTIHAYEDLDYDLNLSEDDVYEIKKGKEYLQVRSYYPFTLIDYDNKLISLKKNKKNKEELPDYPNVIDYLDNGEVTKYIPTRVTLNHIYLDNNKKEVNVEEEKVIVTFDNLDNFFFLGKNKEYELEEFKRFLKNKKYNINNLPESILYKELQRKKDKEIKTN